MKVAYSNTLRSSQAEPGAQDTATCAPLRAAFDRIPLNNRRLCSPWQRRPTSASSRREAPIVLKKHLKNSLSNCLSCILLLQDLICRVLSKLTTKEVVRTSVLSSTWNHMWEFCPKLRFDGTKMCGTQQYIQKFAGAVSAALQHYQGKMVVGLDIKFEYDNLLVDHVDSWVGFALSSSMKNLALDLVPANLFKADFYGHDGDRYKFPSRVLENRSLSHLQQLQLSFLSFQLPPRFSGFPDLKNLELHLLQVSRKDLEYMLSSCPSLEWLSMVRCHLNGKLKMAQPLSHLLYLRVECCNITSLELDAPNLRTFICSDIGLGAIDIGHALEVREASLFYLSYNVILEDALTLLPKDFPSVQRLILHASIPLEVCDFTLYVAI
ncbi:hypothetical protein PR202_ga17837 [Eleusine coracana subsp. coracana]|uniref:Uncharacterized protein n=1 Tax=Eleusine coracana subsp. coracana TaxID=191504 RepID=A0AAV5CR21_ELECO|nr:hypothetical protein PR202_ga17837 [Eleusine coracana subsp. coracana]